MASNSSHAFVPVRQNDKLSLPGSANIQSGIAATGIGTPESRASANW